MTNALTRVRRGIGGAWQFVRTLPVKARLVRRDLEDRRAVSTPQGPSVQERQDELVQFYSHYEELVEALCDAAQAGLSEKFEQRYQAQRKWMIANYPSMRPYAVAYLMFDEADAEQAKAFGDEDVDAFESLFAAPRLEDLLKEDDGNMIWRIMRTRDALTSYGEHLRQLVAKQA